MKTFEVSVTHTVTVKMDEQHFDEKFMESFRRYFWNAEDLKDHAEHLAILAVTGRADNRQFVEGYGVLQDNGVNLKVEDYVHTDVMDPENP